MWYFLYFFWKKLCCFTDFIYLCSRNACPCEGGYVKNLHRWNETSGHLYGQSRKTFSNVTVCNDKSSKFESSYSGNATEASTWVDFISPCGHQSLYIYNKVYALNRCTLFAYICVLELPSRGVCIYHRWRGQALRCLSL